MRATSIAPYDDPPRYGVFRDKFGAVWYREGGGGRESGSRWERLAKRGRIARRPVRSRVLSSPAPFSADGETTVWAYLASTADRRYDDATSAGGARASVLPRSYVQMPYEWSVPFAKRLASRSRRVRSRKIGVASRGETQAGERRRERRARSRGERGDRSEGREERRGEERSGVERLVEQALSA